MPGEQNKYDTSITSFTPDGRVLQVEYARKAVGRGALSFAMKYRNGILLMADHQSRSRLIEESFREKITKINERCWGVSSGLVADSRILINYARRMSVYNKVKYDEPIDIRMMVSRICNIKRAMTQYGGSRPFGVSMLFCGIQDNERFIFKTDPSGAFSEYNITAIGHGSEGVKEAYNDLHDDFTDNYSLEESFKYILEILKRSKEDFIPDNLEICVIDKKEQSNYDYGDFLKKFSIEL